ncbi:MAG: sulfotransferase domain-containing protein [Bdellovibrionales bacterium]|nr:sulfotransferase domain-containing protein [Bdellovibrionales bacterium]
MGSESTNIEVAPPPPPAYDELNGSTVYLAGGMNRSGSTWLYNAARLLLLSDPEIARDLGVCWVGQLGTTQIRKNMLVKQHACVDTMVNRAKVILYSYRDIRDVLASLVRKSRGEASVERAGGLIHQYYKWRKVAHFVMQYEHMLIEPSAVLTELAAVLRIDNYDHEKILNQLTTLSYEDPGSKNKIYHNENLLHKTHFTDGRHGSWHQTLTPELISAVEASYGDWLRDHNYPCPWPV